MRDSGDDTRHDDGDIVGGIDAAANTDDSASAGLGNTSLGTTDLGSAVDRPDRMRVAGRIVAIVMIVLLVALGAIAVAALRRDIPAVFRAGRTGTQDTAQSDSTASSGSTWTGASIPQFHSSHDEDGDGIDDQQDMLDGARAYVATKPAYASRYYAGGYPDDGYGVCTDVVAQAMKASGYDLMQEVSDDIAARPGDYAIDTPDANIDFRRVPTLKVFFAHTAVALTTDASAIDEWQGGDIVIYDNHIAIVSDKRDADGVPYIIHHYSPDQASYEEDALRNWGTINGHYRLSE